MKCYITKHEREEVLYLADKVLSPMTQRLKTFVHVEKCYGSGCKKHCAEPKALVLIQLQGCIPLDALNTLTEGEIAAEVEKVLAALFSKEKEKVGVANGE